MKIKLIGENSFVAGKLALTEGQASLLYPEKNVKADRNRPSFKIQYPMKNQFFLGKLKTINILKRNQQLKPRGAVKNGELFSQQPKNGWVCLVDARYQGFLSSCQRNYLWAL